MTIECSQSVHSIVYRFKPDNNLLGFDFLPQVVVKGVGIVT